MGYYQPCGSVCRLLCSSIGGLILMARLLNAAPSVAPQAAERR
jgi:hypothetical protein